MRGSRGENEKVLIYIVKLIIFFFCLSTFLWWIGSAHVFVYGNKNYFTIAYWGCITLVLCCIVICCNFKNNYLPTFIFQKIPTCQHDGSTVFIIKIYFFFAVFRCHIWQKWRDHVEKDCLWLYSTTSESLWALSF